MPFVPEMAAHCGYDGIWVDGEHRAFDAREAQSLIAYHHLADIDCMWRCTVPGKDTALPVARRRRGGADDPPRLNA